MSERPNCPEDDVHQAPQPRRRLASVNMLAAAIGAGCLVVTAAAAGSAVTGWSLRQPPAPDHAITAAAGASPAPEAAPVAPSTSPSAIHPQAQQQLARQFATAAAPVVNPIVVPVPKLRRLVTADAVVRVPRSASPRALQALRRRTGVTGVIALDRGVVRLPTGRLRVLGVPLAHIRGYTPRVTAVSAPLWDSVARGELTVGYSARMHRLRHRLGDIMTVHGPHAAITRLRIGAFATLDLGDAQGIVSTVRSGSLGLSKRRELLVAAPKISLDALRADIASTVGKAARVQITRPEPINQNVASSYALTSIPTSYLDLYRRAAVTCAGLPWEVLAGIGTVETGNGRNVHRSTAGAEGPMQFIRSTWRMYGMDADGDGKADIQDPVDAVFSAARYLCAAGAGRGGRSIDNAIFSYNHAWWYVREVLVWANRYA